MNSAIAWSWRKFDQLTVRELEAIYKLRQQVFIVEQDCIYLDIDGKDEHALHLMAWLKGKLVATLRLFENYSEYQSEDGETFASMGRICTEKSERRGGLGKELVSQGIDYIDKNFHGKKVKIGAQLYLKQFYEGFDFKQVSEIYDEDGIDHILMIKG